MKPITRTFIYLLATCGISFISAQEFSLTTTNAVFEEVNGVLAIEAEHFYRQTLTDKRSWHITCVATTEIKPDSDPPHAEDASGAAYLEVLPDTRSTHGDKLIQGENFTDKPGHMAVLHYKVHINNPGRFYVWIRSYSTGSEDNGVHVGLNGEWPESGQRWQTVQKNAWAWDSKQRTQEVHTGVPFKLFLDFDRPGEHELMLSMREDGFEMDKIVLARSKEFKPLGTGPPPRIKSRAAPQPNQ